MKSERIKNYLKRKCEEQGLTVHERDQTCVTLASPESKMIEQLLKQNRELHDRLLAVYAPTVAQTLPGMPSFQVDYRGPNTETATVNPPAGQVELPGTQVGGDQE